MWVPPNEDLKCDLVASLHDSPLARHLGIEGTHELVTRKYTWEKVHDYVCQYIHGCHVCAWNKNPNWKPAGQLQPLPVLDGPWLWTQLDFITQLPLSQGFDAVYVIADHMTKMAHFITCHSNCTMKQLVELHTENVWRLHGLPLRHNTDRRPQFNNPYMRTLHRSLRIDQWLFTVYHPQTPEHLICNNKWLQTHVLLFS